MDWQTPAEGPDDDPPPSKQARRNPDRFWQQPPAGDDNANDNQPRQAERSHASSSWQQPPDGADDVDSDAEENNNIGCLGGSKQHLECRVDLGMVLMAAHQQVVADAPTQDTQYAQNGASRRRIRAVLQAGCHCKLQCMKSINEQMLVSFCQEYHKLSTEAQSVLLSVAYHTSSMPQGPGVAAGVGGCDHGDNDGDAVDMHHEDALMGKRTKWFFLGHRCAPGCLASMLGMGKSAFWKRVNSKPDKRKLRTDDVRRKPQALLIDQFFHETYWAAGEGLPEFPLHVQDVDRTIEEDGPPGEEELVLPDWSPETCAVDLVAHAVTDPGKLPVRFLQHCALSHLWWQFVSWHHSLTQVASAQEIMSCPSLTSFWRVWKARWCKALRFRKTSQHSQCNVCWRLSSELQKGTMDVVGKKQVADAWMKHLSGVYHDRALYWNLRFLSRQHRDGLVVIIIDSMDKSKHSWPQYSFTKPKALDNFIRPRLTVTCAHAHGFGAEFFMSHDEVETHGASHFLEVLCRMILRIQSVCVEKNWIFPRQLVIQSDNTSSQAKNSETCSALATHQAMKMFDSHFALVLLWPPLTVTVVEHVW